jgi:hypothetical protein
MGRRVDIEWVGDRYTMARGIKIPPWYIDPATYGIVTPYSWHIDPYPWYIDPYLCYIDPTTHGISTPSTHGILNPLLMVF